MDHEVNEGVDECYSHVGGGGGSRVGTLVHTEVFLDYKLGK